VITGPFLGRNRVIATRMAFGGISVAENLQIMLGTGKNISLQA
jgi:hypothetical protein